MKVIPCPFCGAHKETIDKGNGSIAPALHVTHDKQAQRRFVECETCGARGPTREEWQEAWNEWNHRS